MKYLTPVFSSLLLAGVTGCASAPGGSMMGLTSPATMQASAPAEIDAPAPIEGNGGRFMSPYTQDEVVAEWVDKAMSAKMGASLGASAGQYAGQKALENVPFFGGMLGRSAGEEVGRRIALEAVGGEEFLRSSSDLSFNTAGDLALFLYAEHSHRENFNDVLKATQEVYPELKTVYPQVAARASR